MTIGSTRTSTQDNSNGTQVATATAEDAGAGALQASVPVGNKTTYGETGRTGLTSNDTGTTDLTTSGFASANLIDLGNSLAAEVRAVCDTASKTLTGRLIFYDGSSNPLSTSEGLSFTTDANLKISGTRYAAARMILDVGQARKCKFYVDSITGTTWDVYVRPI